MINEAGLTVIAGTLVLRESVCVCVYFQTLGKGCRNGRLALLIQSLCISVSERVKDARVRVTVTRTSFKNSKRDEKPLRETNESKRQGSEVR